MTTEGPVPMEEVDMTDAAASVSIVEKKKENAVLFSPELLAMYYSRLFPYHFLYDWLSYDPTGKSADKIFSRREWSFTIDIGGEDIYIRYQSFTKQAQLEAAILQRKPLKIDIGAVFTHPPKDHKAIAQGFKTEQRELVFDIDLTDYDEVRQCGCSGASICDKCWTAMTMAVKVMDQGLRQDFGFQHIAWFYSGRRGVHAWICDEKARTLSNEARSAVASYFEISLGTDKNKQVALPTPLHPMMKRALTVLEPLFMEFVLPKSGHGLLATHESCIALLDTLPESAGPVRENLLKKWQKSTSSPSEKWKELKKHLEIFSSKKNAKQTNSNKAAKTMSASERSKVDNWAAETVFRHTYPRLDINVSKMQNHLLKSPFCVHPKTGRVCVPMEVSKVDSFDPFAVPTLPQLMKELDDYDGPDTKHEWEKTSLRKTFEPFRKNFLEPMWKELRQQQRDAGERQAALKGDF